MSQLKERIMDSQTIASWGGGVRWSKKKKSKKKLKIREEKGESIL